MLLELLYLHKSINVLVVRRVYINLALYNLYSLKSRCGRLHSDVSFPGRHSCIHLCSLSSGDTNDCNHHFSLHRDLHLKKFQSLFHIIRTTLITSTYWLPFNTDYFNSISILTKTIGFYYCADTSNTINKWYGVNSTEKICEI